MYKLRDFLFILLTRMKNISSLELMPCEIMFFILKSLYLCFFNSIINTN